MIPSSFIIPCSLFPARPAGGDILNIVNPVCRQAGYQLVNLSTSLTFVPPYYAIAYSHSQVTLLYSQQIFEKHSH